MPESAACHVCGELQPTHSLARAFLPGGETAVWVCSDHHRCARNIAAGHDPTHPDLDARHGPGASERHLGLFHARMRQVRAEHKE